MRTIFPDALIIYNIFKCGLHYLATFNVFQRIIFASLGKNFFTFKLYRILQWLRLFFDFQVEFNVYLTEFKISSLIVECCQGSPEVASLTSNYECSNPFSVRDTAILRFFKNSDCSNPGSSQDMTCFMIFF